MDEPIRTFELSIVIYGTTSAPFLATQPLKQLGLDEAENFPLGSSVLSDMYIDDVLTGAETLLEAKKLNNQLLKKISSLKEIWFCISGGEVILN